MAESFIVFDMSRHVSQSQTKGRKENRISRRVAQTSQAFHGRRVSSSVPPRHEGLRNAKKLFAKGNTQASQQAGILSNKQQGGRWFLFLLPVAVVSVAVTSEVAGYLRPARGWSHRFPEASIHLSNTRLVQIMSLKRS